jgi:hypothetical protein
MGLRKLSRKRKELGKDSPIITTRRGLITGKNISRVIQRWSKRKKRTVESYDKIIKDSKIKGRFHNPNAVAVTNRLAQKELMKALKGIPLKQRQTRLIQQLLDYRKQLIPRTNIELRTLHN